MEIAVTGPRTALDEHYQRHVSRLSRLATTLVGPGDAEDLVHETFARCAAHLDRLDDDEAGGYLTTALVNRARSRFRRQAVARRFPAERGTVFTSPEDAAVAADDHARVLRTIDRLPARQRLCVTLRFYEELDEDAIAEVAGISRRSVRTHLERARQTLARELGEQR